MLQFIKGKAIVALVLALAVAGMTSCSKKQADEDEVKAAEVPTVSAQVATATRQSIVRTLIVRGTIATAPNQDVKISSLVPGRVTAVKVAEGDTVRQGQAIAEIDSRPLSDQRRQASAALDQAKAALENANQHLARTERLFQQGITARKEVEDARAQQAAAQAGVEQASAALDTATRNLERANVTSPISGQVVKRLVAVGEQVDGTAAQPIVEVANLAAVELAANIPAEYLATVRVGQPVNIICETFPDHPFTGRVVAIAPAVDPANNTALARVLVSNTDYMLKVGMFAQASIPAEEHKNTVVVPAAAIDREQGKSFVYVVNGNVAERKEVTTGIETAETVEVVSGVSDGQKVLTSNIRGLGEKAKLTGGK